MQKSQLAAMYLVAVLATPATAAEFTPLGPEGITLENGDAAIRCAMLSQLAKSAGFFADVPNERMIDNSAPTASNARSLIELYQET